MPDGPSVDLFARELRSDQAIEKPYLLYLQGGPGFESPRPTKLGGWIREALKEFNLVLLDQRGTGASTPIDSSILDAGLDTPVDVYLSYFRADSIVNDAELLRGLLCPNNAPWSIFGQSFGGFCCLTYLSFAPGGLQSVLITGGVPPIGKRPTEIYRSLYEVVMARNVCFYERFPQASSMLDALVSEIETFQYRLPNGDPLTRRRLQSLGIMLGRSDGAAALFNLIEMGALRDAQGRLTARFLYGVMNATSFHTNPIYALLHEAIYCEGQSSSWAAETVRQSLHLYADQPGECLFFDGEMVFPWMFDELGSLRPFSEVMAKLSAKQDWGSLYDLEVLGGNTVPVACLVYDEDMYVDRGFSIEVASQVGACKVWSTNEYEHDGIRQNGKRIFKRLLAMSRDEDFDA